MNTIAWILLNFMTILWGIAVRSERISYKGYKIYEVIPQDEHQSEVLYNLSIYNPDFDFLNLVKIPNVPMHVIVAPKDQSEFEESLVSGSIKMRIVNPDISETIRAGQRPSPRGDYTKLTFNRYYQHNEINKYLTSLAEKFPEIVKVKTVGLSHERRLIKSITITNGVPKETKSAILIDAGIHGREWIAPATALYIIYQLVENFSKNQDLLQNYDWVIIPLVNPDGYEYSHSFDRFWRKTRRPNFVNVSGRWSGYVIDKCTGEYYCLDKGSPTGKARAMYGYGTDGNRNYDSHWGEIKSDSRTTKNPCKDSYVGPYPFSEPETQIVRDIMKSLAGRAKMYLSLHSFGSLILYPYAFTSTPPENWKDLDEVVQAGASSIKSFKGREYKVGKANEVLYKSSGTSMDYAKEKVGIPVSLTMELPFAGTGFDPSPDEIKPLAKESWWGIKAMVKKVQEKYA